MNRTGVVVRRSDEAIRADPNNVRPASRTEQESMSEMKALLDEDAPGETADPTREEMELPVVSICGRCGAEQRGEWKLEWRTNHGCTPHPDAFALAIAKARGDVPAVDPVENAQYEADAERRADLDEHQLDMDSRWLANDHDVRSHR